MKLPKRPLDIFLGTLAVGVAVRALLRVDQIRPASESTQIRPALPPTRKQWAGNLLRTIRKEIRQDDTVMIAAALAFYAMLALAPAAIAAISIFGLILDPAELADQIKMITDVLPESAEALVSEEIQSLAEAPTAGLGIGLAASLFGVLWVVSGGTRSLLHGVNIVYNVEERRPWLVQRAIAYGLTLGLIVFGVGTVALVTFLPGWLDDLGFGSTGVDIIQIARWPAIFLFVVMGLALLYRIGPHRPRSSNRLLYPGAITAAVLWLIATAGFSIYTASGFSSFDIDTYGTLVSVVVPLPFRSTPTTVSSVVVAITSSWSPSPFRSAP